MALAGCGGNGGMNASNMNVSNMNVDGLMSAGTSAFKAVSISDADVRTMSDEACATSDKQNKIAAKGSKYDKRLQMVVKSFPPTINGAPTNYKVYLTKDVNAWAMANGCIRVYSGLMDMMNDGELRGVIGHEMGHVALGHSKKAMQTAYAVSAARTAAGASGNAAATTLSASQLGELTEKVINAQFSQSQESDADDYSFDQLTKLKLDRKGLVTSFQKLAKLEGPNSASMLSSHPSSAARAQHIQQRIDQNK
ncbi:MAG TPA: M48 family metallopeptidase [Herbaspirillum sp.]